ncbi:MAG TPA: hypothetical protein VGL93_33525 [Streptosporangiaceae bacterium]|jgi:hypothetical protein
MSLWVSVGVCVMAGGMGLHRMIWPDRWWKMSFRLHALEHPEDSDVAEARARGRLHSGIMLFIAVFPWVWWLTRP